ncbi:S-4TM family putative pore-forming effector [Streptomyces erythrochromogenes]|uniref:S-4TM family putative pore-forming effector n=1 Tax=Streptomyces erythrochromogenes TaxID=285574 RepID=UPI0037F3E71F
MAANLHGEYEPPTSARIKDSQNEDAALRLLVAQRRIYSKAKRWLALRWFGMLVIGLGAPVLSVIWPKLAVASGAIAGLWIFVGQSILIGAQSRTVSKAAAVQEQYDFHVFGMPGSVSRSTLPTMEEIAEIAGPDPEILRTAAKEEMLDWYPVDVNNPGFLAVAICQRANAAYSDRLLASTATVWTTVTAAWMVTLVAVSVAAKLSLATFLAGVLLPVLPAFLDVARYVAGIRRAARDRADLTRSIEARMRSVSEPIDGQDLLVWQESMYELRRSTPLVPDAIYRLRRAVNERAMKTAASQLGQQSAGHDALSDRNSTDGASQP